MAIKARYFKLESFGAVDGPGTRLILFLQGCSLRCKYCHNPESWDGRGDSNFITVNELLEHYEKNRGFYDNGGGITVSGGEPTMHLDFLLELAEVCFKKKIHLTIDTAAYYFNKPNMPIFNKLIKLVSLWLIDIKHLDNKMYEKLTGSNIQHEIEFIDFCEKNKKPYWIRQVLVPGWTDQKEYLIKLGETVGKLKYMTKFEILPYHDLAKPKYKQLGMKYVFDKIIPPYDEQVIESMKLIQQGIKNVRKK